MPKCVQCQKKFFLTYNMYEKTQIIKIYNVLLKKILWIPLQNY